MSFNESSMAKKKGWLSFLKKLFVSEAKSQEEKKSKKWRWIFGRLKLKQYPALTAPNRTLNEAREEQRKHAINVAIVTAAAADAAVAAAHAAAEVVRLMNASQSYNICKKGNLNLAAIKIQSAFRGHLARKAFRALKGLVRLQAMVRGRIVRRQVITRLKCLPSISNRQPQLQERRVPNEDQRCKDGANQLFLPQKRELGGTDIKLKCINTQRSWGESMFSKEDMESIWLRKQEAIAKRERMKKYSFSNRERRDVQMLEESIPNMDSGRPSFQLEQWAKAEAYKRQELENLKRTVYSNVQKPDMIERLNSPILLPRRSFCRVKQNSIGDDSFFPSSPVFPTYMAATESAKAKARSMSMPKQRLGFLDTYSDCSSPYKNELPIWSSFNGESFSSNGKSGTSQQISVSMKKGLYRDTKDVSFGSQQCLLSSNSKR